MLPTTRVKSVLTRVVATGFSSQFRFSLKDRL